MLILDDEVTGALGTGVSEDWSAGCEVDAVVALGSIDGVAAGEGDAMGDGVSALAGTGRKATVVMSRSVVRRRTGIITSCLTFEDERRPGIDHHDGKDAGSCFQDPAFQGRDHS